MQNSRPQALLDACSRTKLDELRERVEHDRSADRSTFDDVVKRRLRSLVSDLPAVWNDPATPARERKRIVALLLEDVTLRKEPQHISLGIRFRGGATSTVQVPLPRNAWRKRQTHPNVVVRVAQLLEQHDVEQVAELLNAEGLRTGAEQPFDADAVRWVRYSHGFKTPQERLREAGKLTVREMADRLGVTEPTVRAWARDGRLRATRHGRKPVWFIELIDEQPESVRELITRYAQQRAKRPRQRQAPPPALRERIDELLLDGHQDTAIAEQLNAEGWSRASGAAFDAAAVRKTRERYGLETLWKRLHAAGKLTTPELAQRLGAGLNTVRNWLLSGQARGRRCGDGIRARWMFDPVDEQPEPIRRRAAERATMKRRRGTLSDAAAGRGAV